MSVTSYLRLRGPLMESLARYGAWLGVPELEPPRGVTSRAAFDLALDNGSWRGLAVYIFPSGEWTVFDELSGGLATRPAADWLRLADGGDLVYAGYNDAIGYGELVYIAAGKLVRHFVYHENDPGVTMNVGFLAEESGKPWSDWIDLAAWVDADEEEIGYPDRGLLWIHQTVPGT